MTKVRSGQRAGITPAAGFGAEPPVEGLFVGGAQFPLLARSTHTTSCHKAVSGGNCFHDERRLNGRSLNSHSRPEAEFRSSQTAVVGRAASLKNLP